MQGQILNWDKLDINGVLSGKNKEQVKMVGGALRRFFMEPQLKGRDNQKKMNALLQEMTLATDFPASKLTDTIKTFMTETHYDTGYEEVFDVVNFARGTGFDVDDLAATAFTFRLIVPGDKIDVFPMTGTRSRVFFNYYGGGLGWHKDAFDDGGFWNLEKKAKAFRNRAYSLRAQSFYTLIEAITAARTVAWQAPDPAALAVGDPTYTANRDAQTIISATQNIALACQNKGYDLNLNAGTQFVIVTPLQLYNRVRRALNLHLQAFAGSTAQIPYNYKVVVTMMLAANDVYYVILPKEKMIAGYRMDLTLYDDFDILSLMNTTAGWMRYGGAILDEEQLCRCQIA